MRAHETHERAARHGGFPPHGFASGLLAACPSDGSHDFYLSMMLDVPVPRVPMLRCTSARLPPRGCRMSVNAVDWALRFAPVDARHNGAARVLMCLANVADDEGRNAHPTHRKLAAWCKCSVSTVKRHLSWLEANGLIRRGDQRSGIQRVAPARRVGSVPGEPVWSSTPTSSTRTTSTRPEEDGPQRKAPAHT